MADKWMKNSVKPSHKGIFSAKAKRAGETTHEFAEDKKSAPGVLGEEARLALTFEEHRPGKGRVKIHKKHFKKKE